jgi:hypothetical protein
MFKIALPLSIAALALAASVPTLAQDNSATTQDLTINGVAVPADQVDRIQAHCDTLFAEEAGAGANTAGSSQTDTSASTGTEGTSAEAGTDTSASATDTSGSEATSGTDTSASASGTNTNAAGTIDFATLDLATIDVEACRLGGFTPSTDAEAGAATTTGSGSDATDTSGETTTSN